MPRLQRNVIWVWRERLTDEHAFITCFLLAEAHQSFDLVLLEIGYGNSDAASLIYKEHPEDIHRLTCKFSAGRLKTGSQPVELLVHDVPPEKIQLLWQGSLLASLKDHYNRLVLC